MATETVRNEAAKRLWNAFEAQEVVARDMCLWLTDALTEERRATVEWIREQVIAEYNYQPPRAILAILDEATAH